MKAKKTYHQLQRALYIMGVASMPGLTACHDTQDDLFTTATISISAGDTVSVERVQGQLVLTNINSRQNTSSADFAGASSTLEILRGAYLISVEGVLSYRTASGKQEIHQFRAQEGYVELTHPDHNETTLQAILLD